MEIYKNTGGSSGVAAYETGADAIIVQFSDGAMYLYDYAHTGEQNVEHMKKLAVSGSGLNSFISRVVRKNFAKKIK